MDFDQEEVRHWRQELERTKQIHLSRKNLPAEAKEELDALEKNLAGFDQYFVDEILRQLAELLVGFDGNDQLRLRFAHSILSTVKSKDPMEMLLVTQMIAVHVASMNSVKLMKCTKSPDYDHGNIFNKLARTYMNQLAMLQQYRSGPEPKLTVHNVSVNDGGQAIVGHVTHKAADKVQPPPIEFPRLVADQSGMAMPVIEQDDQVVATAPLIEHDQEPDPTATRRRRRK